MESPTKSKHASMDLAGSVFLITSDGKTLNLPIPSKSHRDPLNWSRTKRAGALLSLILYSIMGLVIVQGPSLMFRPLAVEFDAQDLKPFRLDNLLLAPPLFMGIGAFLWIPLSLAVGRRTVVLLVNATLLASTIWAGLAGSFVQLLVAVSIQGLAEGAATSVMILMVIDLTFIHQRPQAIAMIYSMAGAIVLCTLSLVPQMTDEGTNWRMFYHIWVGPVLIVCLCSFFLLPETYFLRPAIAFDGRILTQSATEKIQIYPDWEAAHLEKELPETPYKGWRLKIRELKLWGKIDGGWKAMGYCYVQIMLCFVNPLVFWVMILNCLVFGGMMSIGSTYVGALSAAPYNLSIQTIALVNVAGAAGSFLAYPVSGCLTACVTRRLAIRNKGIRDADMYLPAFLLPVLASAASLVIFGLTASRQLHFSLVYVSYALNSFGFVGLAVASTIWITEAFPRHAAPALAVVIGGSYISSFGLSFAIMPWIKNQGIEGADIELAVMIVVVGCVAIPVAFYGKKLRQSMDGRWAAHEGGALRPQSARMV